jgi:hypothetical protein
MFTKWFRARAGLVTCACEREWPGLFTEMNGQRIAAVPSPEGSSYLVTMLGLVAHCAGCGALPVRLADRRPRLGCPAC